jgi:hypothetical protein
VLVEHDETWQYRLSIEIERACSFGHSNLGGTANLTNSTALDNQRLVLSGGRTCSVDDPHVPECHT